MTGLWQNNPDTPEGKYLVQRRDGTIPEWPYFVLGAKDPAAFAALKEYATVAARLDYDPSYVADILILAAEFERYLRDNGASNPTAPPYLKDSPKVVAAMKKARGA